MATTTRPRLFVVRAEEVPASVASPRRDRWMIAVAIGALVAMLALLGRPLDEQALTADEGGPSLLAE